MGLVPENTLRAASLPRDDVVEDFVREFFRQFEDEPAPEVSEEHDSFTVRLQIHGSQESLPQLFVVTDTIAARASRREVAVVIIRCGSFERWVLLPGAIDAGRVSTELTDGVLSVTLPKSIPEG